MQGRLQTVTAGIKLQLLMVTLGQGAKKIIFIACHLGKLKLAFTSSDIISISPKSFLMSRIDFTLLVI